MLIHRLTIATVALLASLPAHATGPLSVPEPTTLSLFAAAIAAGVAAIRLRK